MSCCPDHGDLVLDLARGVLDDESGRRAEELRSSCPRCAEWWTATFSDETVAGVGSAVGEVFASFTAPSGTSRWWAAAAAAALVLGVGGSAVLLDRGGLAVDSTPQAQVITLDFESGDLAGLKVVDHEPGAAADVPAAEAVFSSGLEDGDLSGWTSSS